MRRMHPLVFCSAAAMIALALGTGAASAEDKTFELKLSHWVPPTHPLQKAIEQWGADVEQASGGTIKYKVFPSQQLGKAFDHYDMARDGIADFTYVNPGYQPGRFPIIAAGELPTATSRRSGVSVEASARSPAGRPYIRPLVNRSVCGSKTRQVAGKPTPGPGRTRACDSRVTSGSSERTW